MIYSLPMPVMSEGCTAEGERDVSPAEELLQWGTAGRPEVRGQAWGALLCEERAHTVCGSSLLQRRLFCLQPINCTYTLLWCFRLCSLNIKVLSLPVALICLIDRVRGSVEDVLYKPHKPSQHSMTKEAEKNDRKRAGQIKRHIDVLYPPVQLHRNAQMIPENTFVQTETKNGEA